MIFFTCYRIPDSATNDSCTLNANSKSSGDQSLLANSLANLSRSSFTPVILRRILSLLGLALHFLCLFFRQALRTRAIGCLNVILCAGDLLDLFFRTQLLLSTIISVIKQFIRALGIGAVFRLITPNDLPVSIVNLKINRVLTV